MRSNYSVNHSFNKGLWVYTHSFFAYISGAYTLITVPYCVYACVLFVLHCGTTAYMEAQKTKTIAYIRVSTAKQVEHGVSLEAQRAKAEAYAALYDLELVEVVVDAGESAKSLDRPGLQRALSMLTDGLADALLVVKLDRLTRSVRDLGLLVEQYFASGRWSLMSTSEQIDTRTATGRMVLNLLSTVSQWERETIGERTSAAMSYKRKNGGFVGGKVPYGYTVENGQIVPCEREQALIQDIVHMRAKGMSYQAVANNLTKQGRFTRKGTKWGQTQIIRIAKAAA